MVYAVMEVTMIEMNVPITVSHRLFPNIPIKVTPRTSNSLKARI